MYFLELYVIFQVRESSAFSALLGLKEINKQKGQKWLFSKVT